MTDTTNLPPLPTHPEPHTYRWTELELRAIEQYGAECRRAALDEAARWFTDEDNRHMFHGEMLWPHQVADRLRALKDKP